MLQIAIDDREIRRAGREHAFDNRRSQRTCGLAIAISRAMLAVPSGESSSTKMTSHEIPFSTSSSLPTSIATLCRSLKHGTMTASSIAFTRGSKSTGKETIR